MEYVAIALGIGAIAVVATMITRKNQEALFKEAEEYYQKQIQIGMEKTERIAAETRPITQRLEELYKDTARIQAEIPNEAVKAGKETTESIFGFLRPQIEDFYIKKEAQVGISLEELMSSFKDLGYFQRLSGEKTMKALEEVKKAEEKIKALAADTTKNPLIAEAEKKVANLELEIAQKKKEAVESVFNKGTPLMRQLRKEKDELLLLVKDNPGVLATDIEVSAKSGEFESTLEKILELLDVKLIGKG